MKKLLLLLISLCFGAQVFAQNVYIPDAEFRDWLNLNYASCLNGDSLDSSCPEVTSEISVNVYNLGIADLTGIVAFSNLETLICGDNLLTELPELPATLITLSCINNQLTALSPTLPPVLESISCYNNQLTTLPSLPSTLESLKCYDNQLVTLPTLPNSLIHLECQRNQIATIPNYPAALNALDCSHNLLTSFDNLHPDMTINTIDCSHNLISYMGALPDGLEHTLNCGNNQLTQLPDLPVAMETLICDSNLLTSLPSLPLTTLNCMSNQLTTLPDISWLTSVNCSYNQLVDLGPMTMFNGNFSSFNCSHNQLTSLPPFDLNDWYFLDLFDCSHNQITVFPQMSLGMFYEINCSHNELTAGPDPSLTNANNVILDCSSNNISLLSNLSYGLSELYCSDNGMTVLDSLPDNVYILDCSNNDLAELPPLTGSNGPNNLNQLNCSHNQLVALPNLPESIEQIDCSHNQLQYLPPFPAGVYLTAYDCSDNNIGWLPEFTNYVEQFDCSNNNLNCLPTSLININLPDDVTFSPGNNISCIPDDGPWGQSDYWSSYHSLPICNANFMDGCDFRRTIQGQVYVDADSDCMLDGGETPLAGWVIESDLGTYAISDSAGFYSMLVYPFQTYELDLTPPQVALFDISCPGIPYSIPIDTLQDTIPNIDFPVEALESCHWLDLNIQASFTHRPCFNSGFLTVNYCNLGSLGASDAYIDLSVPSNLILMSSTIPWTELGNDQYRFELGDIGIGECGSFIVHDSIDCNLDLIGYTDCFEATIYPISQCLQEDPTWNQASLQTSAICTGSEIEFILKNVGNGDMDVAQPFTIYKDNLIFSSEQSVQLNANDSLIIPVTATGEMFHLTADQVIGHPGVDLPRVLVEGCGPEPHSQGLINSVVQNDQNDYIDIDCFTYVAAYDPNDKRVVPSGYGPNNNVTPEVSLLEYTIRFQNTGTDTAFNVQVIDTLPAMYLDPATFQSLNSSHPYEVFMYDSGIVVWSFDNILLPDSFVNEPASNGFVKFKIRTREDLPLGTVINNTAAIYFDFNEAVITENCFITLAEEESLITSVSETELEISAMPNPFSNECLISLDRSVDCIIQLTDPAGRIVFTEKISGSQFTINGAELMPGMYLVNLIENDRLVGTKRVSLLR